MENIFSAAIWQPIIALMLRLLGAVLVLVIGWLVAKWISGLVGKLLKRTSIDNRVANWAGDGNVPKVEDGIAKIIFYILMLFVLVAFFEVLGLTIITEPLNALLNTIFAYLPSLLAASILIVVAWLVATILRGLTKRVLQTANVDKRLGDDVDPERMSVSKALSDAVYWLVWLIFLPPILGALGLQSLVAPLTGMLDDIMAFLPKLFAAVVILVVGWFVAKILRRIVTAFLAAIGTDEFSDRIGLSKMLGKQNLSGLIGLIVFILVLIPVIISSLEAVQLDSLTQPLSNMLDTIFTAIPAVLAAAVVLFVAYIIARLVADLVADVLEGIGFDNIMVTLGLSKEATTGKGSPSNIVGYLVLVAIMLLAVMAATSLLNIPALSLIVAQFIAFAWRIVIGLIIFGLGLWLASLVGKVVEASNWPNKNLASMFGRIAVIALATAMALSQMGLADSIINLAFGLTLGALAFAIALAFGLGGREVAGKELESWVSDFHAENAAPQIETADAEAE
ncbi:MAG TPA: mechanosensitive ion channel [Caldilineae bacterium]|nr:mechanosensitive ion channel [Caldilineae bacterium]